MGKVALLLGAGASCEAGVPMMPELGRRFLEEFALPELRDDLTMLSSELAVRSPYEWAKRHNVEILLQHLAHMLAHDADPLRRRAAAIVRFEAMKFVLKCTSQHKDDLAYLDGLAGFIPSDNGLEIFSLNYDTVIEDWCRQHQVTHTDGFGDDGLWAPERFAEARYAVRLSKLHGSVTWATREGVVRRVAPAGEWRTEIQWGKLSSLTLEAALIYPATEKGPSGLLQVLLDRFGRALKHLQVLVVAGYRCADEHILGILGDALANDGGLQLLVCNPSARNIIEELRSRPGWHVYHERLHACPEGLGTALARGLLGDAQRLSESKPSRHSRSEDDVLLGSFRVVRLHGRDLILGASTGSLLRLERGSGLLHRIRDGFGNVRDLAIAGNTAFVVDCRLGGYLTGLGGIWRVDLRSGRRRLLAGIPGLAALGRLARQMRKHAYDGLAVGLIRWPTSICTSNDPNVLFVLAARRVIRVSLLPLTFTDITGHQFFNASAITFAGDRQVIVAEHVFGADISPAGIGVLWAVDVEIGTRRVIRAGVKLGHGLAFLSARNSIVATQIVADATWELIEFGIDDGKPLRSAGPFRGKAAFVMIDDDTAIVSSEREYEKFQQPFLLRARLEPLSGRRTEA